MSALRADIDHYRRGEVISARPVSPVDLLKKLVVRNKLITGVIAASVSSSLSLAPDLDLLSQCAARRARTINTFSPNNVWQLAGRKEQEAMAAADEARSQQAQAENALAEMQRAEMAARAARRRKAKKAVVEAQPRASAGRGAARRAPREEQPQQIADTPPKPSAGEVAAAIPPVAIVPSERRPRPKQPCGEARRDLRSRAFRRRTSTTSRRPREKLSAPLTEAMDSVAGALVSQPDMIEAWMLKGRLHWALMEFDRAVDSFRRQPSLNATGQRPAK